MTTASLIAGFLSGIAAGMGLGGGTVLLIYLTLLTSVEQLTAQGINLFVFVPTALVAVIIYAIKRKIRWRLVLYMAPLGILGSVIGSLLLPHIPTNILSKTLGGVLIFMGVTRLFSKIPCKEKK